MKITDLKTFIVGNPPPSFGGRYFIFLKLVTDDGDRGAGRGLCRQLRAPDHRHDDRGRVRAPPAGQGSLPHRDLLAQRLWPRLYPPARPSLMGVMSGLEMACWDIVGKAVSKPVYELLGGKVHERLRTYTYLYPRSHEGDAYSDPAVYRDADVAAERAAEYVAQGFTAVKFDPAGAFATFDPRQPSLERLELSESSAGGCAQAVGTKCDLLFGTHGQFTVSGALRLARRIEPYEPLWFEEPTPPEMPEEMAKVARGTASRSRPASA